MTARADARQLRRRCEAIVAGVRIPTPFSLSALCAAIGDARGRPVRVLVQPFVSARDMPCGVWVRLADEDVIFVEARTSPLHQSQIGLHELAHIVCGHDDAADLGAAYARRLLPDLDPAMVQRVLGRTSYASAQEREAEIVATLLGELIADEASNPFPPFGADDPESSEVLIELFRALGGRGGG